MGKRPEIVREPIAAVDTPQERTARARTLWAATAALRAAPPTVREPDEPDTMIVLVAVSLTGITVTVSRQLSPDDTRDLLRVVGEALVDPPEIVRVAMPGDDEVEP